MFQDDLRGLLFYGGIVVFLIIYLFYWNHVCQQPPFKKEKKVKDK